MVYMLAFTINIPPMLAYIPYMDPMGIVCYSYQLVQDFATIHGMFTIPSHGSFTATWLHTRASRSSFSHCLLPLTSQEMEHDGTVGT